MQLFNQILIAEFFGQRFLIRKKICAQRQTVSFNLYAHGSQRGRIQIKGSKLPIILLHGFHRCVDKAVINGSGIVGVHLIHESGIHRQMVAADHNGGVFIEWLFHDPVDKVCRLPGGAGQNIGVWFLVIISAQVAVTTIREMRIRREHCEVKWRSRGRKSGQFLFCVREQLFIFKTPPFVVILRQTAGRFQCVRVKNTVIAMLREINLAPMEFSVGPQKQNLVIPLLI